MTIKNQSKIVNAFLNPEFYDDSVNHIKLVETHISWVFLTGKFAYKLKKPVKFDFLDFKTLAQRKYYCEQELKLNKRLAPDIYLDVIPVTKLENNFSLAGEGKIIDYVVKMKQFDNSCLLNKLIKNNQLKLSDIDNLSEMVADFHSKISIAGLDISFGSTEEVIKPVEDNFSILNNILPDSIDQERLNSLHSQMLLIYKAIYPQLLIRKQKGFIRECHGDLHLGNIALIKNQILLFDGIEFNDSLRWIDTISDCAFLIMDLQDHNQFIFANHFVNHYLLKTGDYSALAVLKFYQLYRAMVRAKVAGLRLQQHESGSISYKNTLGDIRNYLKLAETYVQTDIQMKQNFLAISYGISGSGKSWLCSHLADKSGAIQLRSDVERKRLLFQAADGLYSDSTTHQTYTRLMELCEIILNANYSVIIDATFLDAQWRQKFCRIAEKYKIPFHILNCYADQKTIVKRLEIRHNEINNISDADVSVMEKQLKNRHHLKPYEKKYEIPVDTAQLIDYSSIMEKIQGG